jgi:hypothetical protein
VQTFGSDIAHVCFVPEADIAAISIRHLIFPTCIWPLGLLHRLYGSAERVDDDARVGEHRDVAVFHLIGRGGRVLSSAYAAPCRNALSLASSSEYCLRSTSAPWYNRKRINQCNRTLPRCWWRCDQVTPGVAPCASDFVVLQFPFIVRGTIERNRLALARSAGGFPSGRAFFDLGKNRIAHVARLRLWNVML